MGKKPTRRIVCLRPRVRKVEQVSEETGEYLGSTFEAGPRYKVEPDSFVVLYEDGIDAMMDLSGTEMKVLLSLAAHAALDQGFAFATPGWKHGVSRRLGISVRYVNMALRSLLDREIVRMVRKHEYELDPELHWRGSQAARLPFRIAQFERLRKEREADAANGLDLSKFYDQPTNTKP